MRRVIFLLYFVACFIVANAQWKAYLSYYEPTEIERTGDGTLYVLASGGVYSYNPTDQQLITYDKTTVLSDCGIAHIAWCQAARRLVILYNDYNIDLLSPNGNVVNMPAYKNTSMTDDKTVNSLDISGNYAYLSTSFGIVQLNVADASFTNTYRLGFRIDYSYTDGGYLYAASSTNGIYRGLMTNNLLDPSQWSRTGEYTARPKTIDPTLLATVRTLNPGGPKSNDIGRMKLHNNKLYTSSALPSINGKNGILQIYDGNNWRWSEDYDSINSQTGLRFSSLFDFDIDPKDDNHIYVGCQSGLYEFNNLRFTKVWNVDNSPLLSAATIDHVSINYVITTGTKYDRNGNLWVMNSISPSTSLFELSPSEEWTSHHKDGLMLTNEIPVRSMEMMNCPIFDSRNLLWFVNNSWRTPALVCYQPSTDNIKVYTTFINEDNTEVDVAGVRCVAEDIYNNIWIGTNQGPLMLETDQITSDSPIFTQVKVPRNDGTDLADYLLSGVDILSLAIDKGNRKWFGTNGSGVYLISSDNLTQIQHFTQDNSPLLSNTINSIEIDNNTGEVFFGTDNGLCSYTTNIPNSDEGMTKDNVYAYPNPVRPDYKGAITITGLEENADVKILTSSGALVNEGKASGGQYKWYGLDENGKRVASGIYMIAVATAEGDSGVVCKVAIVN